MSLIRLNRAVVVAVTTLIGLSLYTATQFLHQGLLTTENLTSMRYSSTKDEDHNDVLLISYMRTGSSFLGRLLGFRNDTFYVYEPLWTQHKWKFLTGGEDDILCSVLTPDCNWEKGVVRTDLDFLRAIYTCQFAEYQEKFAHQMNVKTAFSGPSWKTFENCEQKTANKTFCFLAMETVCKQSSNRVTKVIRMDVRFSETLLLENQRLKVVHLFRDPRAVINSHLTTKWFPMLGKDKVQVERDIQVVCKRIRHDFQAGLELLKKYPDRVKIVQYEDITVNTIAKIQTLYKFLGMQYSQAYESIVFSLISKDNLIPTKASTFPYRKVLAWETVQKIDEICKDVILMLGLRTYPSKQDFKNVSFSPVHAPLPFAL